MSLDFYIKPASIEVTHGDAENFHVFAGLRMD